MTTRRQLLGRATAAIAGVVGLSFGSGAFTETTANRSFSVSVADDDTSSQLVVEPTDDPASSAVSDPSQNDSGTLEIDGSGISPSARTAYGEFSDLDDATTLNKGVFVIRNENTTGNAVDITVGVEFNSGGEGAALELGLDSPNSGIVETTTSSEDATIMSVPSATVEGTSDSDASVECGIIVDSDSSGTLDATISIDASLSGPEV